MIVSCKCCEGIICHKKRGEEQDDTHIAASKPDQSCVRAQKCQCLMRNKNTCQHKRNAAYQTPEDGLGKIIIGRCAFCGTDIVSGGGANPDHRSDREDQSEYRKDQIQDSKSVCATFVRDKKGICQNVDGDTDHSGNTL